MPNTLLDQYRADGFVTVENALSADELERLRERMTAVAEGRVASFPADRIEYEPGASASAASIRKINACAENDDIFMQHATNPRLLDLVEQLIGSDIKLYGSQCFMKPPGGVEKPWHQDSAYFQIEPKALVTCWTALDDVTTENGCLWVIPGSHLGRLHDHTEPWQVGDRIDMQVPESQVQMDRETPITMPAGSCSFHHSMLLHRSGPNRTAHARRGLAVHYMAAHSRWTNPQRDTPTFPLLRGRT